MDGANLLRRLLAAALIALMPAQAEANDSSSVLAAGGLVLVKTDAISMQREDLLISPSGIRVRYEMRNDQNVPVTLRVAFPLPEIPIDTPGGLNISDASGQTVAHMINLPFSVRPNFIAFLAWSDGKPLEPEVEVRAVLPDGRNIADALREIGGWSLVMYPKLFESAPKLDARAEAQYDVGPTVLRKLHELGVVDENDSAAWPKWRTYVTFHWQQTFRPGVTIIEHRYQAVVGQFMFSSRNGTWIGGGVGDPTNMNAGYCIDASTDQELRSMWPRATQGVLFAETLSYILTTGANWAGPIGTFHLTVDGVKPAWRGAGVVKSMSLCSEFPLQRTGPLRLEGTAQNYTPKQDLRLLMVMEPSSR